MNNKKDLPCDPSDMWYKWGQSDLSDHDMRMDSLVRIILRCAMHRIQT
jgi:hypothetical protein